MFDTNSENYKKSLYADMRYIDYSGKMVITTTYDNEKVKEYPNYEEIQDIISSKRVSYLWEELDDRENPQVRPISIRGYRALVKPVYDLGKEEDLTVEEYNYLYEMEVINRWL